MADRKTVMSWLEGLAQDDWAEWHSDSEVQTTAQAALDLLKAQEPRVMTLDEAAAADEVWVEMWHGVPIMVAVLYITDDFKNFELELLGRNKKAFMLAKHYGHTWRCWTAKPTEEQRLAVKWDDNQT